MSGEKVKEKVNGQFEAVKASLGRARSCFTSQKDIEMISTLISTRALLTDLVNEASDRYFEKQHRFTPDNFIMNHSTIHPVKQEEEPAPRRKSTVCEKGPGGAMEEIQENVNAMHTDVLKVKQIVEEIRAEKKADQLLMKIHKGAPASSMVGDLLNKDVVAAAAYSIGDKLWNKPLNPRAHRALMQEFAEDVKRDAKASSSKVEASSSEDSSEKEREKRRARRREDSSEEDIQDDYDQGHPCRYDMH
eukprot:g5383.t1